MESLQHFCVRRQHQRLDYWTIFYLVDQNLHQQPSKLTFNKSVFLTYLFSLSNFSVVHQPVRGLWQEGHDQRGREGQGCTDEADPPPG
jgi:hypothetical protein